VVSTCWFSAADPVLPVVVCGTGLNSGSCVARGGRRGRRRPVVVIEAPDRGPTAVTLARTYLIFMGVCGIVNLMA
jgi:hypothetical protein